MICTVEGCDRRVNARGLCHRHYWRWRKHGTVELPRGDDPVAFFWSLVDRRGPEDCWEFTASRFKFGYGRIRFGGRSVTAHRLAWTLTFGDPGPELNVCHRCDNPPCCNPAHLFLGSDRDNVQDALQKGRRVPRSSIPHQTVAAIKRLALDGWGIADIARAYGVTSSAVKHIKQGRSRADIPAQPRPAAW